MTTMIKQISRFAAALVGCSLSLGIFAADRPIVEAVGRDGPPVADPSKGLVLLAVRWDRRWKCGEFENAQLRVIAFDKTPSSKPDDAPADLVLDDAPLILTKPRFDNYLFRAEPGTYGLSRLEIKVARSSSDVGYFKVPRSTLLKDGVSEGGSFTVSAGEIVYIGHFYLDCATRQPTMWRYYPDGRDDFAAYLRSLKSEFPWLDTAKVEFRLFKTKSFGLDYELP